MSRHIERLIAEYQLASDGDGFEFAGADFQNMLKPCVYLFLRGDEVLYIGMSKNGVQRTAQVNHDHAKARAEATRVLLYPCKSSQAAERLERVLIRGLCPTSNVTASARGNCWRGRTIHVERITHSV